VQRHEHTRRPSRIRAWLRPHARLRAQGRTHLEPDAQIVHVYLADPDAHHARAQAAGARIVQPLYDTPWARAYYALDLEGFLWGFSTYKPA